MVANSKITVSFGNETYSEIEGFFGNESLYMACLKSLEAKASDASFDVTESMDEEFTEIAKITGFVDMVGVVEKDEESGVDIGIHPVTGLKEKLFAFCKMETFEACKEAIEQWANENNVCFYTEQVNYMKYEKAKAGLLAI